MALTPAEAQKRMFKASRVFSPTAPIDQRRLFAGRMSQLQALLDAVTAKGQHAVVYGERGVGKTSLVSILGEVFSDDDQDEDVRTVRQNCHRDDTFGRIWMRALETVELVSAKQNIGFGSATATEVASLAGMILEGTPDEVVRLLRRFEPSVVFVFDEFDQLADKSVAQAFSEVIKALSDFAVPTKVVIVGVGDDVDALIASHASVERAIRQIRMPRMEVGELADIMELAMGELNMTCAPAPRNRIVRISQGLPHYVHSLGLYSSRSALGRGSESIAMDDVTAGIKLALENAHQSQLDSYLRAISSPQTDNLYRHVLLACALARTDELGYFTPASVREPLRTVGRPLEIPAFAGHLNKFASDDRGNVLQKTGTERRFRYRFRNPLLQPFVVMRGIADGLLPPDALDQLVRPGQNAADDDDDDD